MDPCLVEKMPFRRKQVLLAFAAYEIAERNAEIEEIKKGGTIMARVIDAIIRLHDQFSPVLKKVSNSMTETEKLTNRFGKNLKAIGGSMSAVGSTVSMAMAPILAASTAD